MDHTTVPPHHLEEVNVLDYLTLLWRYRWLMVAVWSGVIGSTVVFTVTTPKMYESTATLLAPKEGSAAAGLLGGLAASGLAQAVAGPAHVSANPNPDLLVPGLNDPDIAEMNGEKFG